MTAAASLRLRARVGRRYELLEPLGAGGMGEVWAARHVFTRRRVALKLLRGILARRDPEAEGRFFEEAALQAAVRHPGVVDVLDAGREPDGSLFLVMELLRGETLESAFRHKRLPPRSLVRVMVHVLDALGACHAVGVVHRDLKPSNIFLARSPVRPVEVKVLDFGIATRMDAAAPALVVGTLDYMSPEQARGEAADARSDIYSASSVLFRGLAGRTPYACRDHAALLQKMERGSPPSLGSFRPDLPPDLVAVVDRGLSTEPGERWSTAEDMAQALALVDRRGVEALPAPSVYGLRLHTGTADVPESPWDDGVPNPDAPASVTTVDPTLIVPRPRRMET